MKRGLVFASVFLALFFSGQAWASTVVSMQPGYGSGTLNSFNTGTAATQAAPWLINETITSGPFVLNISDTDGTPLQSPTAVPTFTSGSWFAKTVTNNTGVAWTSFELELQQILGTASGEGDGLSFAQLSGLVFSSSIFTTYSRIDIARDYLNFSGGTVNNGGSVIFYFAVTDNSPSTPFYLWETPNKQDVAVPEPLSMILLGLGLLGVAGLARKK